MAKTSFYYDNLSHCKYSIKERDSSGHFSKKIEQIAAEHNLKRINSVKMPASGISEKSEAPFILSH